VFEHEVGVKDDFVAAAREILDADLVFKPRASKRSRPT
jgi:hypothetical protein